MTPAQRITPSGDVLGQLHRERGMGLEAQDLAGASDRRPHGARHHADVGSDVHRRLSGVHQAKDGLADRHVVHPGPPHGPPDRLAGVDQQRRAPRQHHALRVASSSRLPGTPADGLGRMEDVLRLPPSRWEALEGGNEQLRLHASPSSCRCGNATGPAAALRRPEVLRSSTGEVEESFALVVRRPSAMSPHRRGARHLIASRRLHPR